MEKFAIIYDFDKTLCTDDAPMFGFFPYFNLDGNKFFREIESYRNKKDMESLSAYLYYMKKIADEKKMPLTKDLLHHLGEKIEFYPGLKTWFKRINNFGKKHGFQVEHYIISSGISELIEGCKIAKNFKKIFASAYHYNEKGIADWPLNIVNYTNKTQFIFRINKGLLNNCSDSLLNGVTPKENRAVKYENMIYIGDGFTDVPSMKTMISKNGYSIAVYSNNSLIAKTLIENKRCDKIAKADYRKDGELEEIVKQRILNKSKF